MYNIINKKHWITKIQKHCFLIQINKSVKIKNLSLQRQVSFKYSTIVFYSLITVPCTFTAKDGFLTSLEEIVITLLKFPIFAVL